MANATFQIQAVTSQNKQNSIVIVNKCKYLVTFLDGKAEGYGGLPNSPAYKVSDFGSWFYLNKTKRTNGQEILQVKDNDGPGREIPDRKFPQSGDPKFFPGPLPRAEQYTLIVAPDRIYAIGEKLPDNEKQLVLEAIKKGKYELIKH